MRVEDWGGAGVFAGALWVAGLGIGRAWSSYALGGLSFMFLGFLVVPGLSGVFELEGFLGPGSGRMEDLYNDFFADASFLVVCAFLAVTVLVRRDGFASRLPLIRELPIPAAGLVAGRAICMLLALLVNALAFFLPVFLLSALGDLGASYLWFAGVWVGYGLLASGLWLLMELTEDGGIRVPIFVASAISLVVVLALLEWTADLGLVWRTAELVRGYGALPAVFSVLAGAAAFVLLARLTVRRIRERDVFWESSS
jgi:hypothetical protein